MKRKYCIGDKIRCKDGSYNTVVGRTVNKNGKGMYICNCEKGHEMIKATSKVDTKCPYCINQKVAKGINDISTTNKSMFEMIKNKEFAYTHHDNSPDVTEFRCPICGFIVEKSPQYIKKYGLRCPHCSSGYSYGERFIMNFLDNLDIKYITQYSSKNAKWCGRYRYDFYLKDYDCIIEVQGDQHYRNTTWYSYENIHSIDIKKMELGHKNVKKYILINARKSEFGYIKQSILNSELNKLLYLNDRDIDWEYIHQKTITPIIKLISERYNNYSEDISVLSNLFHVSNPTIVYYLKEASLLGMCDYNPVLKKEKILKLNHANNSEKGSKPIICIEDSRVFRNAKILQKLSDDLYDKHLDFRAISAVCHGKRNKYKNLHFKFISRIDFNKIKDSTPELAFGDKFILLQEVV